MHTLYESLMGMIHTFVLPSLLTEGKNLPFTIFACWLIHYMHNALVMNDSSNKEHFPNISTLDSAHNLFALAIIAISLNVFDKRTDLLLLDTLEPDIENLQQCQDSFDLNAIHVVEHYHSCYTRGLALNLIHWFLKSYLFSIVNSDIADGDAYKSIFVPFTVHIGQHLIQYKHTAEECGHSSMPTFEQAIWFCKNERCLG